MIEQTRFERWIDRLDVWTNRSGIWVAERWWRAAIVGSLVVIGFADNARRIVAGLTLAATWLTRAPSWLFIGALLVLAVLALGLKYMSRFVYGAVEIGCALAGAGYFLDKGDRTGPAFFAAMTAAMFVLVRGVENCRDGIVPYRKILADYAGRARKLAILAELQREGGEINLAIQQQERWLEEVKAEADDWERTTRSIRMALEGHRAAHDREESEEAQALLQQLALEEERFEQLTLRRAWLEGAHRGMRFRARENEESIRLLRESLLRG